MLTSNLIFNKKKEKINKYKVNKKKILKCFLKKVIKIFISTFGINL